MKTRAIPAQITTVEDRIAGNLNLTQIILLMLPVFALMIVYAILPKPMYLTLYKVPLILLITCICGILALRIKEKVVLQWLIIILRYNIRPSLYLYDKNEGYLRDIVLPSIKIRQRRLLRTKTIQEIKTTPVLSFADLAHLEGIVANPKTSFSLRMGKKGGLRVALEQK